MTTTSDAQPATSSDPLDRAEIKASGARELALENRSCEELVGEAIDRAHVLGG